MVRNLEQLNQHRQASALIRQKRQDDQQERIKQMREELKQELQCDFREPVASDFAAGPPNNPKGAMYRLAKIEDNANQNGAVLQEHRLFLNSVHAERRSRPPSAPLDEFHSRAVEEGARWMGPAMQAAAFHKARATGGREPRPSSAPAGGPPGRPCSAAPSAAASAAGYGRPASRSSAKTLRTATPEPTGAQPSEAVPQSGLYSWRNSRPPSAGSLHARMKAMEDAIQKNHERLATNRKDLDLVARARKERAEQAVQDVLRSIRTEFGYPADGVK